MSDDQQPETTSEADREVDTPAAEEERDPEPPADEPTAEEAAGGTSEGGDEAGGRELSEEIREALEELEELRDRHLRLAAEFENYRKRTRREKAEVRERAQAALAERLLDALDDLERFLEASSDAASAESLREGVEMVRDKLWKELSEAGLDRMEPEGASFDPERHEALITSETEDPEADGTVSQVLLNGYTFGERVLRPARVQVEKYAEPDDEAEGSDGDSDDEG